MSYVKMKLKKDDSVIIVGGKREDKGKVGKIMKILPEKNRLVVEKVHIVKEYVRPNPQKNIQGGIVEREGSVPLASVRYYCGECEQGVRIGYKITGGDDGKPKLKQRVCKKCGIILD